MVAYIVTEGVGATSASKNTELIPDIIILPEGEMGLTAALKCSDCGSNHTSRV